MTAPDPTRLLCAWCGEALNTVDHVLCVMPGAGVCWGWHKRCAALDDEATGRYWNMCRAIIEARGPGRVGKIGEVGNG